MDKYIYDESQGCFMKLPKQYLLFLSFYQSDPNPFRRLLLLLFIFSGMFIRKKRAISPFFLYSFFQILYTYFVLI